MSKPKVTLEEITEDTLDDVLSLSVLPEQAEFAPPNANFIAQAYYSNVAWFRAIFADKEPVGFVMLYLHGAKAEYGIWHLMIDHRYQGKGYGTAAVEDVIEFVRTLPEALDLFVTFPAKEGNPKPFFEKCGFKETGKSTSETISMRFDLADA